MLFGWQIASGGFIGVDVFFVISGYLIARLLFSEIERTGTIDLLGFYERRVRRLLPALITVICISTPVAWIALSPYSFIEFCHSGLASIFFLSNFFFYEVTTAYAAQNSLLKPLLHTWSLSVEEQYYVFFSILVLLTLKFKVSKTHYWLLCSLFLSLLLGYYIFKINPSLAFFTPISRFWELLIGALVGLNEVKVGRHNYPRISKLLSTVGLLSIVFSAVYFSNLLPHPSLWTLIPVLGTALVISQISANDFLGRLLCLKPLTFIGLISYSAYLWHYPIMAFSRNAILNSNLLMKFCWVLISFLLAYASYRLIERPFRNPAVVSSKHFFAATFVIVPLLSLSLFTFPNLSTTTGKNQVADLAYFQQVADLAYFQSEHLEFELNQNYAINETDKLNALVIGDSFGEDFFKTLLFSKSAMSVFDLNLFSPVKRGEEMGYRVNCLLSFLETRDTQCEGKEFSDNLVAQFDWAEIIFLVANWREKEVEALPLILSHKDLASKKVVVIGHPPIAKVDQVTGMTRFDKFLQENKRLPDWWELSGLERDFFYYHKNNTHYNNINSKLQSLSDTSKFGNSTFLNPDEYACSYAQQRCFFFMNDIRTKWDGAHITTGGAREYAKRIDEIGWLKN